MFRIVIIILSFIFFGPSIVIALGDDLCKEHRDKTIAIMAGYAKPLTIETLLIDPQGRKTGFDSETESIKKEIPCSGYAEDYYGGEIPPVRVLGGNPIIDGSYTLQIYSPSSTPYSLSVSFRDATRKNLHMEFTGVVSAGTVAEYKINYDSSSVNLCSVTPERFDGKGQRPIDVNTFLAYTGPAQTQTTLSSGQTTYDIAIYYGKTIIPETFKATLNKEDITSSFHPKAETSELVTINLVQGRNTLILSVDGVRDDGKSATDKDRLVFIVP